MAPPDRDPKAWSAALFRAIDAKDTGAFLGFLAPDGRFAFADLPAAEGPEAIRALLDGFFASIATVRHVLEDAWAVDGHIIQRGTVRYVRLDGREVSAAFCNVLGMAGDRVRDYRIYVDASALHAP